MTDKEAIAEVSAGLTALNRALSKLSALGIEVAVGSLETSLINERATRTLVSLRLTRIKTDIDVQL